MKNLIKEIQKEDPLVIAEQLTGKSYKEDDNTGLLGLAIQMEKNKILNQLMDKSDDTKFSEITEEYLRKVTDFGFEIVYSEDFQSEGWNSEVITEKLYILFHKEHSILLVFDTFRGNINGGNFYYNWSPNDIYNRMNCTSSGGYEGLYWKSDFSEELINPEESPNWDLNNQSWDEYIILQKEWSIRNKQYCIDNNLRAIWVGYHDCREAIKNNINLMLKNGVFLKEWKKQPFLWLLHHGDTKVEGYSYEEINQKRLNLLPDYVKKCILVP